jgi:uncharacterized protein (TIGR02145 family)
MKTKIITLLFSFLVNISVQAQTDKLVDPRDGKEYKTIQIGSQTWMAQNIAYKISPNEVFEKFNAGQYFECYDFNETNCDRYGMLYPFEAAQKVCPVGWHLPSKTEFDTLLNFVGSGDGKKAYEALIEGGISGFEGLLGGHRIENARKYQGMSKIGIFWTSTKKGYGGVFPFNLIKDYKGYNIACTSARPEKDNVPATIHEVFSVRCIKDSIQ